MKNFLPLLYCRDTFSVWKINTRGRGIPRNFLMRSEVSSLNTFSLCDEKFT